ncbi:MAG: Gx transporter family protein [Clostridia bacterium]|nr:Gx transporter family protein [Clostridia bacterium]
MMAQALVLSFFERLIPINFGIPGVKLGLANIVSLVAIFILGPVPALMIQIGRILLAGLMFGSGVSIFYSLSGGMLSILIMILIYKTDMPKVTIIGLSTVGAVFHNIGQILVAALIVKSLNIAYYLPILMVSGVITGIFVGITSRYLVKALYKWNMTGSNQSGILERL